MDRVFPAYWVPLKYEVRMFLIKQFNIKQSSYTQVDNNKLVSDGRTPDDLLAISKEAMIDFLGEKETLSFSELWDLTVKKAIEETTPKQIPSSIIVDKPVDSGDNKISPQESMKVVTGKTLEVANIALGLNANKDKNA